MAIKTNFTKLSTTDDFVRAQGQEPDIKHSLEHSIEHSLEHSIEPSWDFSSLGFPQPSRVYSAASFRASGDSASNSLDISGFSFSGARFVRLGEDLLIISGDESILIASYFSGVSPGIWSAEFGFYSAELVASFLETRAITDGATGEKYALGFLRGLFTGEDGGIASIGVVEAAEGDVQVTRAGVVIMLAVGDSIMLNDIISTGDASEVFLRFADKMEFRLGSDGRLAIDEFIYDEMSSDGTQILSIISGAFSYASGLIAGKDPTSVELKTPYGTIGIRGTKILGKIEPIDSSDGGGAGGAGGNGGGLSVTILEGRVALLRDNTEVADISEQFETLMVRGDAAGDYSYDIRMFSVAEVISSYDFLEGSLEQLEEIMGSSLSSSISGNGEGNGEGGGDGELSAISGVFSIASEDAIERSSGRLSESVADAGDAEDSIAAEDRRDAIFARDDISGISGIDTVVRAVEPINIDIRGGEGNDVLTGTAGVDRLYGEGGRDELSGLGGNDELYGGADDDILVGGVGNDLLVGGAGKDEYQIMVGDGVDIISEVNDGSANEVHFRSSASGSYAAADFSTSVFSKVGNDLLISLDIGGIRQDVTLKDYHLDTGVFELFFVSGTNESPIIAAIAVPTFRVGGSGDDTLTGTNGVDIFDGGAGEDTVSYASSGAGVTAGLTAGLTGNSANSGAAAGDSYTSIENLRGATNYANNLYGDGFNNKLTGGDKEDYLFGGDGNDILTGEGGNDNIHGWLGNDELSGGAGNDELYGGQGNDVLDGGAGVDILFGGGGNDVLQGGQGVDEYHFSVGGGNDMLTDADGGKLYFTSNAVSGYYSTGIFSSSIFSQNGNDLVIFLTIGGVGQKVTIVDHFSNGGTFTLSYNTVVDGAYRTFTVPQNIIEGNANAETLTGTADADLIRGLAGDDVLVGGAGGDILDGGAGEDTANYASASDEIRASLSGASGNTGDAAGDSYISIENLRGATNQRNILTGDDVNNKLTGGVLKDILTGEAGEDILIGGTGADFLIGGAGDDVLEGGVGADRYYFRIGNGNDRITDADGGELIFQSTLNSGNYAASDFAPSIFSKDGQDLVISLTSGGVAQKVTVVDYFSNGGTFTLYYNVVAGAVPTTLAVPKNIITGTSGDDTLTGTAGADLIRGLGGDDVFSGSAGGDIFDGGADEDTVSYASSGAGVTANLADASLNTGDADGDSYTLIENLIGALSHKNNLYGDGGNNKLTGGNSVDILSGGAGDDILDGGAGADEYYFRIGDGNDRITDSDGGKLYFESGSSGNYVAGNFVASSFSKNGQDLQIDLEVDGVAQQVTIVSYYDDPSLFTMSYNSFAGASYYAISIPNFIEGTSGDNTNLRGASGVDIIHGFAGSDSLYGKAGNDVLYGGDGDDFLAGGDGADVLDGGAGEDIANYNGATTGVTANLADPSLNTGDAAGDSYIGIEGLAGTLGQNSVLTGDGGNNKLYGGLGHDTLRGGAGDDELHGGLGLDKYYFDVGDGIDTITGDRNGGEVYFSSSVASGNYEASNFVASSFTKSGNHLQIDVTVSGTAQRVTIVDYYKPASSFSIYYDTSEGGTAIEIATNVIPT